MRELIDSTSIAAIITVVGALITMYFTANRQKKENKLNFENQEKILAQTIQNEMLQTMKQLEAQRIDNIKNLTAQHITDKRVEWIYAVRIILSEYISSTYMVAEKYKIHGKAEDKKIPEEIFRELNRYTAQLKLYFNFNGDIDRVILKLIEKININLSNETFKAGEFLDHIQLLTQHAQIYLKLEWERVKLEAIYGNNKVKIEKYLKEKQGELYRDLCLNEEIIDTSLEQFKKSGI